MHVLKAPVVRRSARWGVSLARAAAPWLVLAALTACTQDEASSTSERETHMGELHAAAAASPAQAPSAVAQAAPPAAPAAPPPSVAASAGKPDAATAGSRAPVADGSAPRAP